MGFSRGQPDWSHAAARTFAGLGQSDLEQANRQNWIFAPFVTGEVIYYEDFEATTLHWSTIAVPVGSSVALSTVNANSKSQSALIVTGTTASGGASMARTISRATSPRVGVGFYFCRKINNGILYSIITYRIDGIAYIAQVRYNTLTGLLEQQKQGGTWTTLGTILYSSAFASQWVFMQVVIDATTGKYVRVALGSDSFSVEDDVPQSAATYPSTELSVGFFYGFLSGSAGEIFIDDVVVTHNEL